MLKKITVLLVLLLPSNSWAKQAKEQTPKLRGKLGDFEIEKVYIPTLTKAQQAARLAKNLNQTIVPESSFNWILNKEVTLSKNAVKGFFAFKRLAKNGEAEITDLISITKGVASTALLAESLVLVPMGVMIPYGFALGYTIKAANLAGIVKLAYTTGKQNKLAIGLFSLSSLKQEYDVEEFTQETLQKTYLTCRLPFEHPFTPDYDHTIKAYAQKEHVLKVLPKLKSENFDGKYFLARGRWVKDHTNNRFIFASAQGPDVYHKICEQCLAEHLDQSDKSQKEKITYTVGNTRFTNNHPVVFFKLDYNFENYVNQKHHDQPKITFDMFNKIPLSTSQFFAGSHYKMLMDSLGFKGRVVMILNRSDKELTMP